MRQTIPLPMSNAGCFGGGSDFQAIIRYSPALHGFMPDNAYGTMQPGGSNPMYRNIGVQPGFQCAAGSYGMRGANMGIAGFSQPDALNLNMAGRPSGNFGSRMPLLNAPAYDNLTSKGKPKDYKEGGQAVKFDTFHGTHDKLKALLFLQQFDAAFAGGNFTEASKIRKAATFLKTNALQWWTTLLNQGVAYLFTFSLLGIAPLAERLGFVTEQLANFTGATVGGLLNATFGNATEMIISLFALQNGLTRVVQLSLLGSILSNMLLVLGCAFFSGGLIHMQRDQKFNQAAAVVNSGLLLMAVMGLLFPAVLHSTHTEVHDGLSELNLSRFSSCIMLIAYASYLYFQLKSHRQLYDTPDDAEESGGEPEEVSLSLKGSLMWLGALTLFISLLSNYLVDAIEEASSSLNIPLAFISVIILPIVGNAAEHASAIMFALKDKLDLSLAVAIGSSTQISMFVIPFCVVVGWIAGKPMDLNFQLFETATLFTTVIVVAFMLQEGKANYFKGLMLVLCYLIVGASFFVHNDILGGEDKDKH
ncbi:hypothetical protein L7F22_062616 [Adiantum nelumboides]|nr:hypothetical protein [Adiantum nelumboides]